MKISQTSLHKCPSPIDLSERNNFLETSGSLESRTIRIEVFPEELQNLLLRAPLRPTPSDPVPRPGLDLNYSIHNFRVSFESWDRGSKITLTFFAQCFAIVRGWYMAEGYPKQRKLVRFIFAVFFGRSSRFPVVGNFPRVFCPTFYLLARFDCVPAPHDRKLSCFETVSGHRCPLHVVQWATFVELVLSCACFVQKSRCDTIFRRPKSIHQYCAKGSPTNTLEALWCTCIFPSFPLKTSFLVYTKTLFCLLRRLSFQSWRPLWCILFSLRIFAL